MLKSLISVFSGGEDAEEGVEQAARGGKPHRRRPRKDDPGKWIWLRNGGPARNTYVYARKSFDLNTGPQRAVLKVSAETRYKLHVNGRYIGQGPVPGGSGYVYYDTYDVRSLLVKGRNVIAFLVHHVGENTYSGAIRAPGLICQLAVEARGRWKNIFTDETWKLRRAPDWTDAGAKMSRGLGFQEVYDASKRIDDWKMPDLSDSGWPNAVVVGRLSHAPWGQLREREIPPLREERVLPHALVGTFNSPERSREISPGDVPNAMASAQLKPLQAGSVRGGEALLSADGVTQVRTPRGDAGVVAILDFGREVSGNVEIGITASGRGIIDIGYSELLEDGRVKPNRGDVRYTDRILLGGGRLCWQSFAPRAFRYMQIEFRWFTRPLALEHVRVNQTTYPVEPRGSFECSDKLLNDIWNTAVYTTRLCMQDTFIESPFSERGQWWPDARITSRAAYYAFGDTKLLAQGLRQIASSQRKDGAILGLYPAGEQKLTPDFALFWVFSLLDYHAFSEDTDLLRELYPNLTRLMKWFSRFAREEGLLANVRGKLFIDWAEIDKRGCVTALNCLYHQALQVSALIANIVGRTEDAAEYAKSAQVLRAAVNKLLYVNKRGLFADCIARGELVEKFSRQTNVLAALFDVPDQYQRASIYRQLLESSLPEIETTYFASHLLEALCAGDRHQEALDYIRRRWGAMVEAGATTLWEYFNQEGGLCHGWSVGPARHLIAEYVGIKPVPGAQRYSVAPHPADLTWAKGSIATKTGPLKVEWRNSRNSFTIKLEVPQGVRVDVYPPCEPDATVSVDGKHWPSRFATLGVGKHLVITTAPRSAKPKMLDKSLEPKPMPHVQILGEISQIGMRRRRAPAAARGRRGPRPRQTGGQAVKATPKAKAETARSRRSPRRRPSTSARKPEKPATPQPPATQKPQSGQPPRRRRGGRGQKPGPMAQ